MARRTRKRRTTANPGARFAKKKKQCCSSSRSAQFTKQSTSVGSCKKTSGRLTRFLKVYKGLDDYHIPLFESVKGVIDAANVLYAGSYFHLSASLVFDDVQYVDCDKKMEAYFEDCSIWEWLEANKRYDRSMNIKFLCGDFENQLDLDDESFDLLISLNAGLVSRTCSRYLKVGGVLLAGDGHYDARFTFVNSNFSLVGVYDLERKCLDMSKEALEGHFITRTGKAINKEQVQESADVTKAKRSFRLQKEALFYVFKKLK